MFSFARQKRTRKAPATFDAREARPGFHPGPKSGGRRNKIGRCACGTDAFSDFAPAPIWKALTKSGSKAGRNPLRHGFAVPPLPKGRGFGKGGKFTAYRLTSYAVNK